MTTRQDLTQQILDATDDRGSHEVALRMLLPHASMEELTQIASILVCQHELDMSTLFAEKEKSLVQGLCRKCGKAGVAGFTLSWLKGDFTWETINETQSLPRD